MSNPLLATKPLDTILKEASETDEHSLKRALGPINLITLGIGAIIVRNGKQEEQRANYLPFWEACVTELMVIFEHFWALTC